MKQQHGYVSVSGSKVSLLAVGSFETQARSVALVNLHGTYTHVGSYVINTVTRHHRQMERLWDCNCRLSLIHISEPTRRS